MCVARVFGILDFGIFRLEPWNLQSQCRLGFEDAAFWGCVVVYYIGGTCGVCVCVCVGRGRGGEKKRETERECVRVRVSECEWVSECGEGVCMYE